MLISSPKYSTNREVIYTSYTISIDGKYDVNIDISKVNMQYYSQYIPDHRNIVYIPSNHLPNRLDKYGYEDNWSFCFHNCISLKSLPDPFYNGWNNATNISGAFYDCRNISVLPSIPNGVTNMSGVFYNCKSMKDTYFYIYNDNLEYKDIKDSFYGVTANVSIYCNYNTTTCNSFDKYLKDSSLSNNINLLSF